MDAILPRIESPLNLRALSRGDLPQVARELRAFRLSTVAATGGHLSSNLGTVELTVALHYVFDTPRDRIVWDVGHQTYPHKILTGRRDRMGTLRQIGGLSGFPRRDESEYDAFGTAHSSQQARRVSQAQTGLTGTARQLDAFILSNTLKGREASYDIVTSTAPSTEAERELARWLLAATGETSFTLDTGWLKGWETTQQRALTFLEQVQQSLTYQAWVESRQSDVIIGRTAVNWHGDFKTLWGLEAGRAEIASHTRCLTIALNTRAVWMRISMIVAQSAIKLALLASTNPLLALPAVLRYIQQALEQYQKLSGSPCSMPVC